MSQIQILPSLDQYPRVFVNTRGVPTESKLESGPEDFRINPMSVRSQGLFSKGPSRLEPDRVPTKDPLIAKFGETDRIFA